MFLPELNSHQHSLRPRRHNFSLSIKTDDRNFLVRQLFADSYWCSFALNFYSIVHSCGFAQLSNKAYDDDDLKTATRRSPTAADSVHVIDATYKSTVSSRGRARRESVSETRPDCHQYSEHVQLSNIPSTMILNCREFNSHRPWRLTRLDSFVASRRRCELDRLDVRFDISCGSVSNYTLNHKKRDILLLTIALANLNRFL